MGAITEGSAPFGERLRRLREAAGLTQEQLAEKAGLSVQGIAKLESGRTRRPYPHTLRALADALELSEEGRAELMGVLPRQRGRSDPSPTTSPPPATVPQFRVPSPLTRLVGRERELRELGGLFHEGARLVTLTGPGGVGKTGLGIEVGRSAAGEFSGGVAFVALAPVSDPELVLPTIARSLGVAEVGGKPLQETLRSFLLDRHMLLVLDNLEQVLDAAPDVADLLASCPDLAVLITSQAPLRVQGEQEYPLRPLEVPELTRLPEVRHVEGNPAVALFVGRARGVVSDFALARSNAAAVAAICRRLDGLPLAIELAAARIRAMDPTQLLARLDSVLPLLTGGARDLPERQRTMRSTIGWSYQLLAQPEWRLLNRLSVFRGGWDLEAAEAVGAGGDITEDDVLDLLSSLVEQSLVLAETNPEGNTRYRMLEPTREYVEERLGQSGEAEEARSRHAGYYLALAQTAEEELAGPGQAQWLERLDRENDNLRAALAWVLERDVEIVLRVSGALRRFWEARGLFSEGRRWLDAALAAGEGRDLPARAKALGSAGWMAYWQGEPERALSRFEEGAALCGRNGDQEGLLTALDGMGSVLLNENDAAAAAPILEESVAVGRELQRPHALARALATSGAAAGQLGDHELAGVLLEESLAIARRSGDRFGVARSLYILGALALERGDDGRARTAIGEGLSLFRDLGDHLGIAHALETAAVLAALRSRAERAVRLWAAADATRDAMGSRRFPIHLRLEAHIAEMRTRLDDESYERALAEGEAMTVDQAIEYALLADELP